MYFNYRPPAVGTLRPVRPPNLRRLEGQEDLSWRRVAEAIGVEARGAHLSYESRLDRNTFRWRLEAVCTPWFSARSNPYH